MLNFLPFWVYFWYGFYFLHICFFIFINAWSFSLPLIIVHTFIMVFHVIEFFVFIYVSFLFKFYVSLLQAFGPARSSLWPSVCFSTCQFLFIVTIFFCCCCCCCFFFFFLPSFTKYFLKHVFFSFLILFKYFTMQNICPYSKYFTHTSAWIPGTMIHIEWILKNIIYFFFWLVCLLFSIVLLKLFCTALL